MQNSITYAIDFPLDAKTQVVNNSSPSYGMRDILGIKTHFLTNLLANIFMLVQTELTKILNQKLAEIRECLVSGRKRCKYLIQQQVFEPVSTDVQ